MIDPELKDKEGLPLTCRAVFIIGASSNLPAPRGISLQDLGTSF